MKYYIATVIAIAELFLSCDSNDKTQKNEILEYETACNKNEFRPTPLKININTVKDTTIRLNENYDLLIPKESFGNIQQIELEIVCYSNLADILLNNLTTVAENKNILCTKGMFEVNISGDSLHGFFYINKSNTIPYGYHIFYGKKDNDKITWLLNMSDVIDGDDSSKIVLNNAFEINRLGWINVDKFYQYSDTTQLLVNIGKNMSEVNFSLVFKNEKTVLPLFAENGKLQINPIPANIDVTIVGIGMVGKDYYYQFLDLNTNDKNKSFPELIKVGKDEIKSVLTEKFGNTL